MHNAHVYTHSIFTQYSYTQYNSTYNIHTSYMYYQHCGFVTKGISKHSGLPSLQLFREIVLVCILGGVMFKRSAEIYTVVD